MPLADIVGHDRVIEVFRRAIRSGKTSHAYIFEGPAGCGRRSTALAIIQTLFCQADGDDACGVCPSCRKVAGGSHADIRVVEPDGQFIKIDQVRELQRELSLRPYEAPRKACLIEQAERFNLSSANALLKTLEEPPGNAIIILLTENAGSLLPTVRSRCQLIRFAALAADHVRLLLERSGVASETARLLAPMAGGSMEAAASLDDDRLTLRRETLLQHLSGLDSSRIATVFNASEELGGSRDETLESLDLLISCLRDVLQLASGGSEIANESIRPALYSLAQRFPLEKALRITEKTLETRRAVQRNANGKLALDRLFLSIAATS